MLKNERNNIKALVKFSRDWADEFTAEQFRVFNDTCEAREFIQSLLKSEDELYFGTNEFYDPSELDETDFTVMEITDEEYAVITRLFSTEFGTGIL